MNSKKSSFGDTIKLIAGIYVVLGIIGSIAMAASEVSRYYGIGFALFLICTISTVFSGALLYGFGVLLCDVNEIKDCLKQSSGKSIERTPNSSISIASNSTTDIAPSSSIENKTDDLKESDPLHYKQSDASSTVVQSKDANTQVVFHKSNK